MSFPNFNSGVCGKGNHATSQISPPVSQTLEFVTLSMAETLPFLLIEQVLRMH